MRAIGGRGAWARRLVPAKWWSTATSTARRPRRLLDGLGLRQLVEPRVRVLVADGLGVRPDALVPEVSLTDELAADSLDLLDLALAVEGEFGISIAECALAEIRTYRDLVDIVLVAVTRQRATAEESRRPTPSVRVHVIGSAGAGGIQRAGSLSPYAVQLIAEDARHAGDGAAVEVGLPEEIGDAELGAVRDRLTTACGRGVRLVVYRDRGAPETAFAGLVHEAMDGGRAV